MALEGTIRDFGLPDIFQLIGLQRKTGTLSLTNPRDGEVVTVTFESGMVVMADSSPHRLEDRLGHVLVKQGKLTRERLEEALSVQKQTLQRLGHILAGSSGLTARDLRDALQIQVSQIVFRVFRWRDGRYQFTPSNSVDYDRENFSPMSTDFILMEGIRMVDEWPIIEKKIPSFSVVFRPVVDPSLIEVASATEAEASAGVRGGAASGRIRLAPEEERIFRKVDGVRTVQAIIDSTGAAEFEVCRILFDFVNRNLIGPVARARATGAPGATGVPGAPEPEEEPVASASALPAYLAAVLVTVLALAGLGLRWRTPFAIPGLGSFLSPSYQELQQSVTQSRIEKLQQALDAWTASHGTPPATLGELAKARLVDPAYLLDARGRPLRYRAGADGYGLAAEPDPHGEGDRGSGR